MCFTHLINNLHMITIVSATNRAHSYTLKVAQYYKNQLLERQQAVNLLSLEDLPEDILFSNMFGKRTENFQQLLQGVYQSDKFIFVIPEYNGSFPAALKAFIDASDFPNAFLHKKTALVGISAGKYGNIRGVDHFTGICHYLQLHVLPLKLHISHIRQEFNEEGALFKTDTLGFIQQQVDQFVAWK